VRRRPISIFLIMAVALAAFVGWAAFRAIRKLKPHSVILHWNPSKPNAGVTVIGYNVYRSTTPGGPYVKLAPLVADPTYTDWLVSSGRTYYYVVTAVDSVGHESNYSEPAVATIP
jgi:fibronectin type 3 domain-containing protein